MSIRVTFRVLFGAYFIMLSALAVLASLLVINQENLARTQARRLDSIRFVNEIRQTVDNLTAFARQYLRTGNPKFLKMYQDMLAIRDGRMARPVYLEETYWDILAEDVDKNIPMRSPISFRGLLADLEFNEAESKIFEQLVRNYEKLNVIEEKALGFNGRLPDPSGKRLAFIETDPVTGPLFGDEYNRIRLSVKQEVAKLIYDVNQRATAGIAAIERDSNVLHYGILLILLILSVISFFAYRTIIARIVRPIMSIRMQSETLSKDFAALVQTTRAIASGTLDVKFSPCTAQLPEIGRDEIGELVVMHNRMLKQLEESGSLITGIATDLWRSNEIAHSADRAKSEFLANISHEIRTPMNAIIGFSELLTAKVSDPVLKGWTEGIRISGKNLLQLINDILDLSKIESGRLEIQNQHFRLDHLVAELAHVFSMQGRAKRIQVNFKMEPEFPVFVELDEGRLRQVLINLVGNAIKFTGEGRVDVNFFLEYVEGRRTASLQIFVQDTGIGIKPSDFSRIFEAFSQAEGQSTRKFGGTGLGLTISRRLTDMMGGSLRVTSRKGEGSIFTVEFPEVRFHFPEMVQGPNESQGAELDISFDAATIVIGEDAESNIAVLRGFLEHYPFHIVEASNGREVLEKVREYRPQLLLLDIQMPVLDGISVMKILRESPEFATLPIIVLTASEQKHISEEVKAYASVFLRKPIRRADLIREMMGILSCRAASAQSHGNHGPISLRLGSEMRSLVKSVVQPISEELRYGMNLDRLEKAAECMRLIADGDPSLGRFAESLQEAIDEIDASRIKGLLHDLNAQLS